VVAILPKPSPPTRQLFQMPLGRLRAFGLEFALEPEIPLFNFLPFSLPEKTGVGRNSRSVDAEINPDNATGRNELRWLDIHDHMQPPTRWTPQQVCGGKAIGAVEPSQGRTVRRKGKFDPTCYGGKPDDPPLFFEAKAAGVVTHHASLPLRRRDFLTLFLPSERRTQRLRRLHARRDHKLRRQIRMCFAQVAVSRLMVLAIYKAFERWRRTNYVFPRLLPTLKSGGIRRGGFR
jgi:hypothetical protein